jgi:uncharacterized membrane protein YgaE (UPF0421/DUF939 family)
MSVMSWRSSLPAHLRDVLHDPMSWIEWLQLAKTVVAAVIAWLLAAQVFGLPQSFLAPWAALLVVHATVYRTFSRGLRQVAGAVLGVLLAWAVGNLIGLDAVAVTVLLVAGLGIGATPFFHEESTAVAATGLIVLTTGFSTHDSVLLDRLFDTGIGIGVGLLVNLLVWPPLRDYSAAKAIDAIDDGVGELLRDMAEELQGTCGDGEVTAWIDRTRTLDEDIDAAWALLRQAKESGRLNPRRAAAGVRTADVFEQILRDNEQAVAESRSMARSLGHSIEAVHDWEPVFRDRWLALLREAGEAIGAPDSARVTQVRADLNQLAHDLSTEELSARHWPEYGGLLMNLRNVVTSMDRVAEQNPVVLPRYRDRPLRG